MNEKKANSPTTQDGAVYHLRIKKGDIPGYVLLPGAPERTDLIASLWEKSELLSSYREYRTAAGTYKGTPIAATSVGIGCPGMEIALHELTLVGAHTCIRVGTTGSICEDFGCGDIIIPYAGVRHDGTSDAYVEKAFPAFAHPAVVAALAEACETLGYRYGLGITCSTTSFYLGQGRPLQEDGGGYWPSFAKTIYDDMCGAGVTNFDMDTAGQFVVGHLHGVRMGSVLSVIANRRTGEWGDNGGEERACRVACEAIKILRAKDEKGRNPLRVGRL